MKKNKTIAYLMAASLLVGATFAGTAAYFNDKGTAKNELIVTMGSVDIEVAEGEWQVFKGPLDNSGAPVINNTEAQKSSKNEFKNAKPSDIFYKKITIKNNGTLNQRIYLNKTPGAINKEGIFKYVNVDEKIITDLNNKVIAPGTTVTGYIRVTLDYTMPGLYQDKDGESYNKDVKTDELQVINLDKLSRIFEIEARQTDGDPTITSPTPIEPAPVEQAQGE